LRFILPKLVSPHQNKIDRNFYETAEKNRNKFMQHLFYTFVGDRKSDKTVDINVRVRFYETIMRYWITQINEVFLIFWTVFIIVYFFLPQLLFSHKAPKIFLFKSLLAIIVLFCINRIIRKKLVIPQVKEKTSDEIEEIHKNHSQQLESEIKYVHDKFDLSYGP
jgi:FlaA1/EpsC-like NDP-sugar epimerase